MTVHQSVHLHLRHLSPGLSSPQNMKLLKCCHAGIAKWVFAEMCTGCVRVALSLACSKLHLASHWYTRCILSKSLESDEARLAIVKTLGGRQGMPQPPCAVTASSQARTLSFHATQSHAMHAAVTAQAQPMRSDESGALRRLAQGRLGWGKSHARACMSESGSGSG